MWYFKKLNYFFVLLRKVLRPRKQQALYKNIPKTPPKLTQTSNYDARKIR